MKTVLSIAGTDPSGGAGVQADLKTMTMNGVYAMGAISALVAQNTMGVQEIAEVSPEFLARQLDVVFEDIPPDAVKVGMVSSCSLIETIAQRLRLYQARHIVVDPVMVATSGDPLIAPEAIECLKRELFPLAEVITPNILEAEMLTGISIQNHQEMMAAAHQIAREWGCAVLVKGGHVRCDAHDYLYENGQGHWFEGQWISNPNTHGTGCTLSSAIAANLAKGFDLPSSIQRSKAYVSGALEAQLDLGQGSGPLMHNFNLSGEFAREFKDSSIRLESEQSCRS